MSKSIEKLIEIDADVDTVWQALTTGEGLERWFPLAARVTPGVGGKLWVSWGEGSDWESTIEVWEPSRHMRTVDPAPPGSAIKMAVDYYLESSGGKTVLRLVHSGFADDTWEGELDSLDNGWGTFLATIKQYLEKHRGQPRTVAYVRHEPITISRDLVFGRVLAALGIDAPGDLRVGGRASLTANSGDRFDGEVLVLGPPINLTATAENWSDGVVMVEIEGGRERCRPAIWVSLWGDAGREAEALQVRLRAMMKELFG